VPFNEGHHVVFECYKVIGFHRSHSIVSDGIGSSAAGPGIEKLSLWKGPKPAGTMKLEDFSFWHPFERHIFVCQNVRPEGAPRPSCTKDGKSELFRS
jgi:hypothetical protein